MDKETRLERNPNFISRRIVDESVLIPVLDNVVDMECIYTLNGVGAFIWEKVALPVTRGELEAAVLAEYEADPVILVADLDKFLAEMISIGAVREV